MAFETCATSTLNTSKAAHGIAPQCVGRRIRRWCMSALILAYIASLSAGTASAERAVFYYDHKPVTVSDLTLVKRSAATSILRRVAAGLPRPRGGVWPRERTVGISAAPGYYLPRRGSSRLAVATHIWRMCIQGAALSYLSLRVQAAFLKKHPCDLAKYYHTGRVKPHLLLSARLLQRESMIYARCAGRGWNAAELAASIRQEFHGARLSAVKWAREVIPYIRSEPAWYRISAYCFPLCRGSRVAAYWRSPACVQLLMPAMLRAIRAQRARFAIMVAKRFGTTPFVVVSSLAGARRAAAAAAANLVRQNLPHEKRQVRGMRPVLAAIGSPTVFDCGFGGNSAYFSVLTGLSADAVPCGALVPCKGWPHHYVFISDRVPIITPAPAFLEARSPSFLWDAGVSAILTPICVRVLARCKPASGWFKKPSAASLLNSSTPSVGLPKGQLFGVPLPQLVREPYRNFKWQTYVR